MLPEIVKTCNYNCNASGLQIQFILKNISSIMIHPQRSIALYLAVNNKHHKNVQLAHIAIKIMQRSKRIRYDKVKGKQAEEQKIIAPNYLQ